MSGWTDTRRPLALARVAAVVITLGIGMASFVLSFTALADLAARAGIPERLAWLWPLIVDGTILQATMAVVALAGLDGQESNRRYFWIVLSTSAAVSVVGNGWHAVLPDAAPLSPWLAVAIAVVAPVSLLASTHGLSLLIRVSTARGPAVSSPMSETRVDAVPDVHDEVEAVTAAPMDPTLLPWVDVADVIAARGGDADAETVAAVLHLSYERDLSPKVIGRQLGVEQHVVRDIVAVGDELLSSGDVSVERVAV